MVTLRRYRVADRDWVITANAQHYQENEGFSSDFRCVVADAINQLETQLDDGRSHFVIAEANGCRVGCVFFSPESASTGRIRLFYLDQAYRGYRVGKRMLNQVIRTAKSNGFDKACVSTFDRHQQACRLYASLGFHGSVSEQILAFGQFMRRIDLELNLQDHAS